MLVVSEALNHTMMIVAALPRPESAGSIIIPERMPVPDVWFRVASCKLHWGIRMQ